MSYVVVRVWVSRFKKTSPGHASLALRPDSRTPQDGYISFAPKQEGSVYGPGEFFTYDHDQRHYGRTKDDGPRGYWIANIHGLDVARMIRAFARNNRHAQTYSLFNECATQVHRYLKIGGGDKYAGLWARNALLCWSPDDVEDYARSIVANTRRLGSTSRQYVGAGTVFMKN
jgi:hypothetical protein